VFQEVRQLVFGLGLRIRTCWLLAAGLQLKHLAFGFLGAKKKKKKKQEALAALAFAKKEEGTTHSPEPDSRQSSWSQKAL
jgi:hypothetical protein